MTLLKTVTTLAETIGRESQLTVSMLLARIASAGSTGLLQATVQREMNLAPQVVTKTVQALVGLDLVARSIDNGDSRHRVLRLTEKGRALVASISEIGPSPKNGDAHIDSTGNLGGRCV